MTDRERAQEAIRVLKGTTFGYKIRPHSPRWNQAMLLLESIGLVVPPPPPPPPPPAARLAPRTYNLGGGNQDPRFCVNSPGVTVVASNLYRDEGGYEYNADGLNSGGRWRDRNRIVAGLKPADQMDGRSPCELYNGMTSWPADSYLP